MNMHNIFMTHIKKSNKNIPLWPQCKWLNAVTRNDSMENVEMTVCCEFWSPGQVSLQTFLLGWTVTDRGTVQKPPLWYIHLWNHSFAWKRKKCGFELFPGLVSCINGTASAQVQSSLALQTTPVFGCVKLAGFQTSNQRRKCKTKYALHSEGTT